MLNIGGCFKASFISITIGRPRVAIFHMDELMDQRSSDKVSLDMLLLFYLITKPMGNECFPHSKSLAL